MSNLWQSTTVWPLRIDLHSNMTRYLQQILTQAVITIPLIPKLIIGKYWIKQNHKLWSEIDQFLMQIDIAAHSCHLHRRFQSAAFYN